MTVALPDIIGRDEASALGLKRFFTGNPCKRGHVAERDVDSRECMECSRERGRKRRAADPEGYREYGRKWRAANPQKAREYQRRWRAANKDKRAARGRGSPSGPPLSCVRTRSTNGEPQPRGEQRAPDQSLTEPDRSACNRGKSLDPKHKRALGGRAGVPARPGNNRTWQSCFSPKI